VINHSDLAEAITEDDEAVLEALEEVDVDQTDSEAGFTVTLV
jgi:hypothetical protein